jgi:hypothetical protein
MVHGQPYEGFQKKISYINFDYLSLELLLSIVIYVTHLKNIYQMLL